MDFSLRIGTFSNAYRPLISGVVNSIDLLRKELLHQGHVPFIYAPGVKDYRDDHAGVYRFPSFEVTSRVQFPLAIPCWPPAHLAIARSGLHVIHSHHPFWLGDVAWMWARRLGIPLVYTFHTQYEQYCHYLRLPQKPLKALTRWAVAQFAHRCDLIIAPSPAIRDLMDDYGIKTWTETLPNGIDLSRFDVDRVGLRQQLGWPERAQIGLYAGRIGKEKNLDFLLQAFAPVAHANPMAYCALVGEGEETDSLKELASALGIREQTLFCGHVNYNGMPLRYAAADFFCISSTTEVKPLVVLEALASGLPVLAVAACGTQDTLRHQHDGLLTPLNHEAFSLGWGQLSDDPNRRATMAERARETAQNYSIARYTSRLVELYRQARQIRRSRTSG